MQFQSFFFIFLAFPAGVVELVDTLALGASAQKHGGSSPLPSTNIKFLMNKRVLTAVLFGVIIFLIAVVGYGKFTQKNGFPVSQSGFLNIKLLDSVSKRPITDTDVNIYSDNGIRCITVPCNTEGQEWNGKSDDNGVITIPVKLVNTVTTLTATGYGSGKDLTKDSQKKSNSDWVLELDMDVFI